MTDDEILGALDARFAGVETRLPPTRVAVLDGRLTSTIGRGRAMRRGPWPAALAALAVVVIAVALGARMTGGIMGGTTTESSSTAAGSEVRSGPPAASGLSSDKPLLVLRGATDGSAVLVQHFGWGPTLCAGYGSYATLDGAAVDRAAEAAGTEEGFVEVSIGFATAAPVRVWVGPTAESAARGYGSAILALGQRGDTWIVLVERGWQMVPSPTPKGRTFWSLRGTIGDETCGAPARAPLPQPGLQILRGPADGDSILIEHFHWGSAVCGFDTSIVGLPGAAVDDAIDRSGTEEGWVEVSLPGTAKATTFRVWVGPTAESAAIAHGAAVLAIGGRGDTWIALGAGARQVVSFPTPKGRTFWLLTGGISDGPCGVEPH